MPETSEKSTSQPATSPTADNSNRQPVPIVTPPDSQASRGVQQSPVTLDDSKAIAAYANFCRVTGTPEEMIIDFGLNTQPMSTAPDPIVVAQRVILNFYTAKRLLTALQLSVQRHEAAFGALETDVQRRVLPNAMRPAST